MFPASYFPASYFAVTYWPPDEAGEPIPGTGPGGGAGPWTWPHHLEDEEIVMWVIEKFLELRSEDDGWN